MLYSEAARILCAVNEGKATVKTLALSSKYKNKKQLYALLCETLKYDSVLTHILEASRVLKMEKKALKSAELAKVLLYDFLLGKGVQAASQNQQAALLKHKAALNAELVRLKIKEGAVTSKDLLPASVKNQVSLPRHVRVNLLKTNVNDVTQHFQSEGYRLLFTEGLDYERFLDVVKGLKKKQFVCDLHLDDLLTFAPRTDLHDHVLYNSGDIILQDKASCIPAHVLNAPVGSHVIDCCAAPGNKSTHAAALIGSKGKVFSFDKDVKRIATMNTMTLKAGALNVKVTQGDFLKVNPNDPQYGSVTHILVDPSCSGSGIVSRLGFLTDDENSASEARLENLASFQLDILLHALSFPKAQRVVYSTCSIHELENESVVQKALQETKDIYKLGEALPDLPNRGHNVFDGAEKCLRLSPKEDLCNGFFVACFDRISSEKFVPLSRSGRDQDNQVQTQEKDDNHSESGLNTDEDNGDRKFEDPSVGGEKKKKKKKKKKQHLEREPEVMASEDSETTSIQEAKKIPDGALSMVGETKKKKRKHSLESEVMSPKVPLVDSVTDTDEHLSVLQGNGDDSQGPSDKKPKLEGYNASGSHSKQKNAKKNKKKKHRKCLTT